MIVCHHAAKLARKSSTLKVKFEIIVCAIIAKTLRKQLKTKVKGQGSALPTAQKTCSIYANEIATFVEAP